MASLFAAFGSFLSVILVMVFVPHIPKIKAKKESRIKDVTSGNTDKKETEVNEKSLSRNLGAVFRILFLPNVGFLLFIKLICGIPIGVLQSMFSRKLVFSDGSV